MRGMVIVTKSLKINNLYWFAENLRYEGVEHYFPDRDSDNVERYGCLYIWDNAVKACPEGWRLPTKEDFDKLLSTTKSEHDSSITDAYPYQIIPTNYVFSVRCVKEI